MLGPAWKTFCSETGVVLAYCIIDQTDTNEAFTGIVMSADITSFDCGNISRVLDHNGISQACYIVEMYHSGPDPSICTLIVL